MILLLRNIITIAGTSYRDELEDVTTENDVMGIPSILIFQNGEKLAHLHSANAKSPEQVESFLDENLNQ